MTASAVHYFARIGMSTAGPDLMREFAWSETDLGLVYGAFTLAYGLCMVPAGWASDRFGPRSTITVAMVGGAVATAIIGTLPATASLGVVIFLRFLFGVFSAPLFPSAGALTVGWFRRQTYGRVQGVIAGATGAGATLAPVIIATIVATKGWRASFLQTATNNVAGWPPLALEGSGRCESQGRNWPY